MNITGRRTLTQDDYTIGWICALPFEYHVAREFLDEEHNGPQDVSPHDNNLYTLGRIGDHNIVIVAPPNGDGNGLSSTAVVIKCLLDSFFNIKVGLLVGIGGGAPSFKHDIRLGDIVVVLLHTAVTTLQSIRTLGDRIHKAVDFLFVKSPQLLRSFKRPEATSDRLYRTSVTHPAEGGAECSTVCGNDPSSLIKRHDQGERDNGPEIHYGLIASANTPIKDASVRDTLVEKKDVLCFETEAAGLMNDFPCLVVRGICDYSDSHKNDQQPKCSR
ncbi:hypothetical protein TRIATDRAFT_295612 [Trichoderma atroviride IMI 206040]|uniref:Nucleoside phosphorylase domain-containing protein n=1 Tax=Hypocrea atroviridis (strain ATCC 20476 / IMI 206040) TaxID=452589 RepID=G9P8M0_HYPAI|nr:uncharacterized protein TRIATDRAFT_295612 [Trichoderma atroviride IMI 206040]EHK41797.1 hypothetical protein TRIATDRAFT_295612 [Trichoderma atroviride IMI 206040]